MVPADFHSAFLDSPTGFIVVIVAILIGFYLFVGKKTPADYHRQGKELEGKMQNSQEAERNGEKGEKIEKVSSGVFRTMTGTLGGIARKR